jgi:hypothetical protein
VTSSTFKNLTDRRQVYDPNERINRAEAIRTAAAVSSREKQVVFRGINDTKLTTGDLAVWIDTIRKKHGLDIGAEYHLLCLVLEPEVARQVVPDVSLYPSTQGGYRDALQSLWINLKQATTGSHAKDLLFKMRSELYFQPHTETIGNYIQRVTDYVVKRRSMDLAMGEEECSYILRDGLRTSSPSLYLASTEWNDVSFDELCQRLRIKSAALQSVGLPLSDRSGVSSFAAFKQGNKPSTNVPKKKTGPPSDPNCDCWRCGEKHPTQSCTALKIKNYDSRCHKCGGYKHSDLTCKSKSTCTYCKGEHCYWMCPSIPTVSSKKVAVGSIQLASCEVKTEFEQLPHPHVGPMPEDVVELLENLKSTMPQATVPPTLLDSEILTPKYTLAVKCFVDSGCDINLISEKTARKLVGYDRSFKLSLLDVPQEIILGDKHVIRALEYGTVVLRLPAHATGGPSDRTNSVSIPFSFIVVHNLMVDLILGRQSLAKHGLLQWFTPDLCTSRRFAPLVLGAIVVNPTVSTCLFASTHEEKTPSDPELPLMVPEPEKLTILGPSPSVDFFESLVENSTVGTPLLQVDDLTRDMSQHAHTPSSDTTPSSLDNSTPDGFEFVKVFKEESWFTISQVKCMVSEDTFFCVDLTAEAEAKLITKLRKHCRPKEHKKLKELSTSTPERYEEGMKLMQNFINEKKLVPISENEARSLTNFYIVSNDKRARPVFPLISTNLALNEFVESSNFSQASLSALIMRLRVAKNITISDVSEAYMSVKIGKRLAPFLAVDCSGLGLVDTQGNPVSLLQFTGMTNGLNMAPKVLETILYQSTVEISHLEADVKTSEDWIDSSTEKMISSYMDDIGTGCGQYRIGQVPPEQIEIPEEKRFEAIKDSLMEKVVLYLKKRGLVCKSKKLQLVTSQKEAETLGVQFKNCAESMTYTKLSNLKSPLPEILTYKDALAYLAGLTPCVSELAPPWAVLLKNMGQQIIGLLVAEEHDKRGVKSNSASKNTRSEIWNSQIPGDFDSLLRSFRERFTSDDSSNWSVLRGLDLSRDLEVYVDSSNDIVGYWVTQNGRKLWFQQAVISKLGTSFTHINVKECLGISFALIDICSRFTSARIKMPKIRILSDSKTALSVYRNLKVNGNSGDMVQRAALTKLLNSLMCILTPSFLRCDVSYEFVAGCNNWADELTRDPMCNSFSAMIAKINTRRKSSIQPSPSPEEDCSTAKLFVASLMEHFDENLEYQQQEAVGTINVGAIKINTVTEGVTNVEPSDLRDVLISEPKVPPIIHNFYTVRKFFDHWRFTKDKNRCRLTDTVVSHAVNTMINETLPIAVQFVHDQKISFSDTHKSDEDCVYRATVQVPEMAPLKVILLPSQRNDLLSYIVSSTHRQNGHCKFGTLYNLVNRHFQAQTLRNVCKRVCAECSDCAISTKSTPLPTPVKELSAIPGGPGRKLSMDVYGPIKSHAEINMNLKTSVSVAPSPEYFLTMIDCYTKRRFVYPLINLSTVSIRIALLTNFQSEGFPSEIVCDSASVFKSLEPWANSMGISMHFTQVYSGHSHGLVERVHRDLNESLRAAVASGHSAWIESIFYRVLVQNTTEIKLETTKISPSDLCLKFTPQLANNQKPIDEKRILSKREKEYVDYWLGERVANRDYMNAKRSWLKAENSFDVGQEVLVYKAPKFKLDSSWRSGTIQSIDNYGIILTDGSRHGFNHVKPSTCSGVKSTNVDSTCFSVEKLNNTTISSIPSQEVNILPSSLVLFMRSSVVTLGEVQNVDVDRKLVWVQCLRIEEDYSVTVTGEDVIPLGSVTPLPGTLKKHVQGKEVGKRFLQRATTKVLGLGGSNFLKNLNERLLHVDPAVDPKSKVDFERDLKNIQLLSFQNNGFSVGHLFNNPKENEKNFGLIAIEKNLHSYMGGAGQVSPTGTSNRF